MITGLDLVEWQLIVAAGGALPLSQERIGARGHAIEARLYAEEPERGFLPSIGRITHWRMPTGSARVRIDTGFRAGDEVTPYYDPMLAKLVVWGEDRERARRTLLAALGECEVAGVATNLAFLERVVGHEAFASARLDTGLIDKHRDALFPAAEPAPDLALVAVALAEYRSLPGARGAEGAPEHASSPWNALDGWWLNRPPRGARFTFAEGEREIAVGVVPLGGDGYRVELPHRVREVRHAEVAGRHRIELDDVRARVGVAAIGDERYVVAPGVRRRLRRIDRSAHEGGEPAQAGHQMAPMSGTIVAVFVKPGDRVAAGAPLCALEAMKMEHTIVAPAGGVVVAVNCRVGDRVAEGADLVDLDDAAP
jgi:3-methylcrotonyl-CoA carboxylase alpha subunit